MTSYVTKFDDFNPQNLVFSKLITRKIQTATGVQTRKTVYINKSAGDRSELNVQTPCMHLPFGLSAFTGQDGQTVYHIEPAFTGKDSDPELKQFYDSLIELQERTIQEAIDNGWLDPKKYKPEAIPSLFKSNMRNTEVGQTYPARLRLKVMTNGDATLRVGTFKKKNGRIQHIGDDMNPDHLNGLLNQAKAQIIFSIGTVWFMGSDFGISMRVKQVCIEEAPQSVGTAFAFVGLPETLDIEQTREDQDAHTEDAPTEDLDEAVF